MCLCSCVNRGAAFGSSKAFHCVLLLSCLLFSIVNTLHNLAEYDYCGSNGYNIAASKYIQEQGEPIVIKANGLAAGKGVNVAMELEEAFEVVDLMLVEGVFCSAGCQEVVEEFLEGEEASFLHLWMEKTPFL